MSQKILQVNFKMNIPIAEYQSLCESLAETFARLPGMQWKVWILNEAAREAGGIYLFESQQALNDYLTGPLAAQVGRHPALREISVKTFDVMDGVTAVTRGPVTMAAALR
jgi:hypothetical protein